MITKKQFQTKKREGGQALITLLFFMGIGVMVLTTSALILATNIKSSTVAEQGLMVYSAAESGAEDGLLRLIRQPSVNQTIPSYMILDSQVSISITNGTILSTATMGSLTRKIQLVTSNTNGVITVSSWKEIQ